MSELEIFLAAADIADPQARSAYLDQACAGNPTLRQQVEALVKAHHAAGDFLARPAVQQLAAKTTAINDEQTPAGDGTEDYAKTHGAAQHTAAGANAMTLEYLTPSDQPGSLGKLGHYEIQEVIGQGAFGIVLKAFDEKLHRMVAIKVLLPELAKTSPPRKRFLREARSAAAIRHEHVVAIYAVEEQPIPYLVMEYIPGMTLEQALNDHGPLEVADVLRLGQQIASGLAAAHGQGLIHRDIKPSNILLENGISGRVKISDFGLARAADDASMTQSGTIAGTPLYMSPEQATTGKIDQRSDLFSLASVLYVMVSGRPPFRAPNMLAVLKRVVDDMPRPIAEIIPDIPGWLCAIIAKLHAKKPDDRFATAQEVADLLGRCWNDLQNNRPVRLPAGVQMDVERDVQAAASSGPLSPAAGERARVRGLPSSESETPHPNPLPFKGRGDRTESRRRAWPTIAAVALLAALGLGVTEATGVTKLASTVIRLTTGSGTLVIETDDPGVKVTIDGENVHIQGAGVEELVLKPGKYRITAVKPGAPMTQHLVTVTRGGKQVVKMTMEEIADGSPVSRDPQESATTDDPDRRAAEWVLSIGGKVMIRADGRDLQVAALQDLPRVRFSLRRVDLLYNQAITDEGLTCFQGCHGVVELFLGGTPVTDTGLRPFQSCKNLASLDLRCPGVTDAGLSHFRGCKDLKSLELSGSAVTDAGLAQFRNNKNLEGLWLTSTKVTDEGLVIFQGCTKLIYLSLEHTAVTDAGLNQLQSFRFLSHLYLSNTAISDESLAHFKTLGQLTALNLRQTKFTAVGVKQLAAALPKCRIEWDGGVIEPTMSDDPDRRAAEWVLSMGGRLTIRVSDKEGEIHSKNELPVQSFQLIHVILDHNEKLKDAGLSQLQGLTNLTELRLDGSALTDAGLSPLSGLKNLTHLNLQATGVTDNGIEHLKDLTKMEHLSIHDNAQLGDGGLKHLARMTELKHLDVRGTQVGDAGLESLKPLPNLVSIVLIQTKVSDRGLKSLAEFRKLIALQLQNTNVTDAGLDHLSKLQTLNVLCLNDTKVTEAGVKQLAAALPKCRIEWDGGVIEPSSSNSQPSTLDPQPSWQPLFNGKDLAGWKVLPEGAWQVTDGVLVGKTIEGDSFLTTEKGDWQDFRLRAEARINEGGDSGIFLRMPATEDGAPAGPSYEVQICGIAGHPCQTGSVFHESPVASIAEPPVKPGEWFTLEMVVQGDRLQVLVNSRQLQDIKLDAEPQRAGHIGLQTWSGATKAEFRKVEIQDLRKPDADPDRAAAAWALSVGIPVEIAVGNEKRTVQPGAKLPAEPFELRYAALGGHAQATDEGLAHFAGCRNLVSLHLSGSAITDAGVANFQDCKQLHSLSLESTAVTDAGLLRFAGCGALESLIVNATPVTDAGLEAFRDCRELRHLQLHQTQIGDEGLANFRNCRLLEGIGLATTKVTDAGLVHLRNCRNLTSLNLGSTSVSDAGMEHFRRCRELVQLTLDNTKVTDAGLVNFRDCRKLTRLNLDNLGVTDAGLANFAQCAGLSDVTLFRAKFSEAGLAPLANATKLVFLNLDDTPLTDAGLAHLANCANLERLHLDDTQITDAGLTQLDACRKLRTLTLGNTNVGDAGLRTMRVFTELSYMNLAGTKVTDAGLAHLSGNAKLGELNLMNTQVTDAGLDALKPLANLAWLNLRKTDVSSTGVEALQQALPKCKIDW